MADDFPKISYWGYRLVRREHNNNGKKYHSYAIHEVYYDGEEVIMIGDEPEQLVSYCDAGDLKDGYDLIGEAFGKPILDYEDFHDGTS